MKKVFSFILAAAMLICSASPALAEDSNTVVITTKAELIAAAQSINADANVGAGKTYRLDADINLENEEWTNYIGSVSNPFKGTFDGNKHVIRNYFIKYHDTTNTVAYGLFGAIGGNAEICNLGVENVKGLQYKNDWHNAFGAIAGQMFDNAKIHECYAKNVFAGFADGYTSSNIGSTGNMRAAGAIVGRIDETATGVSVTNCYSLGVDIDEGQTDYDSGVIGYVGNGGAKIANCYSNKSVARYIAAEDPKNSITNCYYTGALPWPWACEKGNNTSADKYHGYVGSKITIEELKGLAATLGDKYSSDNVLSPINDGLPVLTWEYDIPALQGAGTFANPYKIGTASDLTLIAAHGSAKGKYFKMTNDIDMENANWSAPIGNKNVPFEGVFDGDGHKISNITLAAPQYGEEFNLGLFGVIGGDAVILDLGMENVTVAPIGEWGYNTVAGSIAGKAAGNATVKRCYVKNMNLTDKGVDKYTLVMAGGLIGKVRGEGVSISNCYSLGFNDVDKTAANASGLVGELLEYKEVSNCYSDTSVSMTTASQLSKTTNSYAVTNEFGAYERVGTLVTADELKGKAAALGEHYVENAEGYPMLKWETGYDYPDEEQNVPEVEIKTAEELKALATLESTENRAYKLVRDIDLGGAEWTPIGTDSVPFKGKFNGNGHVISNYKITVTSAPAGYIGLFGNVAGDAVITKLGVKNATIECSGTDITGAGLLAGGLSGNAKVTECFANNVTLSTVEKGKIWQAGGLIGILDQQSTAVVVKDCYTTNIVISIASGSDMNMDSGVVGGVRSDNVLVENIYCPNYAAIDWLGGDPYTGTTAYPNGHIVNVHFAGTMPWPWACAKGNNTTSDKWYGYAGTKHDNSEDIKALASTLGESFIDDTDGINGGYPILSWQSEENVVRISTVEQLKDIAADTKSEGKIYRLMNDLDMEDATWNSYIGTKADPFKGEFDGDGHVIRNITFEVAAGGSSGIFGIVGGDAYIHDLGIENTYGALTSQAYDTSAGALAGIVTDTAEIARCFARNVTWETKVGGTYFRNGGGLIGRMAGSGAALEYSYTTNVTFIGDINMDSGLVGGLESNLDSIRNCYSDGPIADYFHAEECTKVVNSYTSIEAYPWPWACKYNEQSPGKWYGYVGTQVSADELKGMAETLGSMFVADTAGDNGGYPKFKWEGETVEISTAAELAAIADEDDTSRKIYVLKNDIDFDGSDWSTPIGTETAPFEGKFDGKGHAIKNVNFALKEGYFGIFGAIGGSGEIKNLGIENVTVNNTQKVAAKVGGVAGLLKGKAKITETYARNFAFTGVDKDTSVSRAGGIVAVIDGNGAVIQNCYATNVTYTNCDINYEGGIAGMISLGADKIINCYSDSTIVRYTNATAPGDVISNSYYAGSRNDGDLPWPWVYGVNTSGDGYIGIQKTKAELKGMASTLGSSFAADNAENPINGGYPVFKREVTWANLSGAGTYNNPYLIKTVADLQELAATEDTNGVYFRLENDIDMQGAQWAAFIGSEEKPFKGDFNGNGHVIKNYKIIATKNNTGIDDPIRPFGLFGVIGGNSHVYNMGIENVSVELEQYEWSNYFGALAGLMVDSANVSGCYVKNVTFGVVSSWTPLGTENEGHFNSAAGLIGLINGDNCEMRHCYALDIGDGKVKAANGTDYHTIMFDAYLVGRGEKFAAFEHCYANGPMMQSKNDLYLKDCYETKHGTEWYTGYTWGAWTTDVWTLSDRWCNDFSPRGNDSTLKHGPTLKWEQYPGYYQNMVTSGMMDANAATLNKIFGTIGATVEAGVANGFATGDILKLPAGQKIGYTVPVEAGATYRISFDGASVSGLDEAISFTFGGKDFAATLKNNKLGYTVDTKAVFYTAETDGDAVLEIGGNTAIYLDDIEVIKVDVPEEKYSIDANLRLDYHKIDVLESDLYVDNKISDGVEVNYSSKNGYIDGFGYLTDAVPVGFGTADDEFTATVNLGAENVSKSMNLKVAKREPYNIENIGLVDANGNAIYDISKAEKIGTVKVTLNSDKQAHLYAAVYKNNTLTDVKKVPIAADGNCVVDLAVNGADKAKVFVLEDNSAAPLALSEKSLDRMADDAKITLHTIGDSICATYTPEDALKGWGQMIGESLDANHVTVDNSLSQGGMTAINFISNGRYEQLLNKLKDGDYVVVQLTHNDQYVVTKHEFRALISQFVYGARQKGATCVFVTSPETSTSATDTFSGGEYVVNPKINNSGYPDVLRTMADELGIPLVDINKMTIDYMKANGYSALIASGMWSTDTVHFSESGARWIASNIAKGMKDLGLPIGAFVTAQ